MDIRTENLIREKATGYLQYMKKLRRDFHRHPELGFEEYHTSQVVKDELDKMGVEWRPMAGTGVVGLIHGTKGAGAGAGDGAGAGSGAGDGAGAGSGKVLLLRADMDALPLSEESGVEYSSEIPGKMHACGHDGHTAALLGTARILSEMRDCFSGTVKLMFQPSEEAVPGAEQMVKEGLLENPHVDFAVSHHIQGDVPYGCVALKSGGIMALDDWFDFAIKGSGCHGSSPHNGDDVIYIASQAISMIYASLNRRMDAFEPCAVSICSFNSGNNHNVLPGAANIQGTIRSYNKKTSAQIHALIESCVKSVVDCANSISVSQGRTPSVSFEYNAQPMVPPVVNDRAVTELVKTAAEKQLGADRVIVLDKGSMGSEDFSFVSESVPTCYFFTGLMEDPSDPPVHHSQNFRWNDDILSTCAAVTVQAVLDILDC